MTTNATNPTAAAVDEFGSFCFAPDHSLINPSTKTGRTLFNDLSKYSIEEKDRFKGKSTEVERFRKHLKEIQSRCNVQDLLVFETTAGTVTKRHNLAEAPEATKIADLHMHNQTAVWGFDSTAAQNKTTVKLADQAKSTEAEKQMLRKAIDIRARNQIIRKILAQSLDPDFMATLVNSKENREHLVLKDSDNGNVDLIDGTVLLLLVARKICPSSVSLVDNLQKKAKSLTLSECGHDVSAVINRFEEFHHRIQAQGKEWDGALKALFKVLLTTEDENFKSAILSKQNKYLDGSLTEVSELSKYAVTIYTNLTSLEQWMVPDKKTAQIAALTTQIKDLNQKLASSGTALTTDTISNEKKKTDLKDSSKDAWKFKFVGNKITRDGKDFHWCDDETHSSMQGWKNGFYSFTHGKGHPRFPTCSSWKEHKASNPNWRSEINKKANKPSGDKSSDEVSTSTGNGSGSISLSDKLKNALLTRTACTEADLARLDGTSQDF